MVREQRRFTKKLRDAVTDEETKEGEDGKQGASQAAGASNEAGGIGANGSNSTAPANATEDPSNKGAPTTREDAAAKLFASKRKYEDDTGEIIITKKKWHRVMEATFVCLDYGHFADVVRLRLHKMRKLLKEKLGKRKTVQVSLHYLCFLLA